MARRLGLTLTRSSISIRGVASSPASYARGTTQFTILTDEPASSITLEVHCLTCLDITTPASSLEPSTAKYWNSLRLADPRYYDSRPIDLLIGADGYQRLIRPDVIHYEDLVAQRTGLGWIITGQAPFDRRKTNFNTFTTTIAPLETDWHDQLIRLMQRFWEVEEVPKSLRSSPSDEECERIYAYHRRAKDGKYVVQLPLKLEVVKLLGNSVTSALAALKSLHQRFKRDTEFAQEYRTFMAEYESLGHMKALTTDRLAHSDRPVNYIPHHGIWQHEGPDRRLRVVFNASRPTSSGYSLNDVLYSGPKLQTDLVHVLTRWRRHRFVFCADVRMMFRQIWVNEKDVDLQRILWCPQEGDDVTHFQLLTVTYGESCSPYLALRTIQQLCMDYGTSWPEASRFALKDRFVDDILTGSDDLAQARLLRDQLVSLFNSGGFPLRKWIANAPELLNGISVEDQLRPTCLQLVKDGPINELGIKWDPRTDCFQLTPPKVTSLNCTKRTVLATVARFFDPCGWLTPTILIAKLFMQDLWRAQLDWDEPLPTSMQKRWEDFKSGLKAVDSITIPRWISSTLNANIQLHGFSDASQRAFAATIYVRVSKRDGTGDARLLVAKSKLAPIRALKPSNSPTPRMTIPRLELRGALLTAQLLNSLSQELEIPLDHCYAWTDSTIVLHWLGSAEPSGKALVDNYVNHIHEHLPAKVWRHVSTEDNPADLATRGAAPASLVNRASWWNGPEWLTKNEDLWPSHERTTQPSDIPNIEMPVICCSTKQEAQSLLSRFSDLGRLIRVVAYARRWLRLPKTAPRSFVTVEETEGAFTTCVRLSQSAWFSEELVQLNRNSSSSLAPPLRSLNVFVDSNNILRVGGRLHNSCLSFSERHPPVLDGRCPLAALIIAWAHSRALHGGFRLTYSHMMRRAWIIGGRRRLRSFLHKCVICVRARAETTRQIMAPLPQARVVPAEPFSRTGVDYAGPFAVLSAKGRGIRTTKGYIAVFVCMSTKALHLEVVGDMTTESFLAAFTRFSSRRGIPSEVWSDNGTYFRRADLELRTAFSQSDFDWDCVGGALAQRGTKWHFIPPGAPHFGALWEAGVKSVKTHLRRVTSPRNLTYEELSTLVISIEAVLNSRPITALSGESDDLDVLTAGHLLIGRSLGSVPEPRIESANLSQLSHWKLVRALRDQLWTRWSREYLNTLQQRYKWTQPRPNLCVGDLVIVVDPSLLSDSGRWPLARVVRIHLSDDGFVRVVTLKTSSGEYVRPVTKLVPIPVINSAPLGMDELGEAHIRSQAATAGGV